MKNVTAFIAFSLMTLTVFAADPIKTSEVVTLSVTEKGFEPSLINVSPGQSVTLNITRKTDSTCAKQIQIPSKKIKKDLPLNQIVSIDLGKLEKGEIRFGCGMNMMEGGKIYVK